MQTPDNLEEAVEILQQLGLKEYEARCFVGLSRLESGTAKDLSELTEVPRTRVYDAIRVLEAHGLVEIQHSSPQQYRAVSLEEATETLRDQHETRVDRLRDALESVDTVETEEDSTVQQVWAMSGGTAIENRTEQLIQTAEDEVVLVLGDASLLTPALIRRLNDVPEDVELLLGAFSDDLESELAGAVPDATTFVSGLGWLKNQEPLSDETAIGRLLMVDRQAILVSTIVLETQEEQAIFGEGFGNGLVVIARRLMAQGLMNQQDPAV
jgi:sugar-specific transcriptional regulator TrmB